MIAVNSYISCGCFSLTLVYSYF